MRLAVIILALLLCSPAFAGRSRPEDKSTIYIGGPLNEEVIVRIQGWGDVTGLEVGECLLGPTFVINDAKICTTDLLCGVKRDPMAPTSRNRGWFKNNCTKITDIENL